MIINLSKAEIKQIVNALNVKVADRSLYNRLKKFISNYSKKTNEGNNYDSEKS